MSELIFSTVHGSHLYGLAHEGSDRDVYYVYDGKGTSNKLRQTMKGDDDSVRGTLDAFLNRAIAGSHQSVEALFSKQKVWYDDRYRPLIDNLIITGSEVFAKYERTIKKFSYSDEIKRRVHAARLSINLRELRKHGRFDPTLTQLEAVLCKNYGKVFHGDELLSMLL